MYAGYYGEAAAVRGNARLQTKTNTQRVKDALFDIVGLAVTALVLVTLFAVLVFLPDTRTASVSKPSGAAVEALAEGDAAAVEFLSLADDI